MKLTCQLFLLLCLILNEVLAQSAGQDISSGFQKSINKFIEKIAGIKKNMEKLGAKREQLGSKKKQTSREERKKLDSAENKVITDDTNDSDVNDEADETDDFDKIEDETNLKDEVDDVEDSPGGESSFLDKLLLKLSKKEDKKRKNKAKIKDIINRAKNRDFLTGLKEKTQRAKIEQRRLSGFLDRFRSSQSNLSRPRFKHNPVIDDDFISSRFRQDPITRFRDILGVPPVDDRKPIKFREDPLDPDGKRSLLGTTDIVPSVQVNKAFKLLDGVPGTKQKDGNIFVFTFADSNNPVLVFDG